MTMAEAMAYGTPVLGARTGSFPEIVVDGETGFLCHDVDAAVARGSELAALDRHACRARVASTFSTERMLDAYGAAYAARAHDNSSRPMAFTDDPPKPCTDLATCVARTVEPAKRI